MQTETEARHRFREDGTPYYVQLAAILRRQIADGSWGVGDKLPTLRQMVATFGVSPMTVRHAVAGLEQEGLVSAERGRGTFVVARPEPHASVPYQLASIAGLRGSGLSFRVVASRPARDELRIVEEDGVALSGYRYMKRIFARDGRPFIVADYLIADDVYRKMPGRLWSRELVSTLLYDTEAVGLSKVRQQFRVISALPREAAELEIQIHDPVVQVRRIFLNECREVLCLARLVYRTDGVVFDINIDLDDRNRLLELGGFPES
ncbi:DNA-binding transcriptional regulator, GntR family [Tistlia consotensis]|uniref:DNA-binding transcriptional regulator, GntR family n=1 Tax=Tistlia consotensis USBA 355 TaxID=560819 RepID=A0A1Y6C8Z4_9PROT|nr:GntR family transcriptional regulator [Tistlia consotensis]SMF52134.1 DNA-binding transcriptional regulator, GntR family [Tistlia consotensis USBA 355]SNR83305.1 DNA-binding transcriptional regulator, GntR family [Tistlia consotensis]